jgi:uncharacterized protein YjbI with pentapeptide repeats/uncharacterized protein YjeT (DUF2065 family)
MVKAKEKLLTREDILRLIEKRGMKAEGLDLSRREFEESIDLSQLNLDGITLREAQLWYAHLKGAKLRGAHLERSVLRGAHLERTDLSDARLEGADLSSAHLKGAILNDCHLKQANLLKAHLEEAKLADANLEVAYLENARLEGADLSSAHLEEAILRGAHLEQADLSDAHLERADLEGANLKGAKLANAHLEGANLLRADLRGATLQEAHLQKANLRYCDLRGAETNLAEADLEGTQLYACNLSQARIEGINWGSKYIVGEEQAFEKETKKDRKRELLKEAASVYRNLKNWHAEQGMYDIAGEFFFREITVRRKLLKWWPNPLPRAWSKFISLICGYGERPLRAVGWAALVIFGLALIYFAIGSIWEWWAFGNALYFSAASFTTLGYGSWPETGNDWIRGIGVFESFIGVFTMALFLVTFVRKMTR